MNKFDFDKEVSFIARHYRKGLFAVEPALMKLHPVFLRFWTAPKIAVASLIIVVLGATGAVLIRNFNNGSSMERQEVPEMTTTLGEISHIIDFDDVPLPKVIEEINNVYGVEIINIPENAASYRLTLYYEGNPYELIETINDILGINLKVKE